MADQYDAASLVLLRKADRAFDPREDALGLSLVEFLVGSCLCGCCGSQSLGFSCRVLRFRTGVLGDSLGLAAFASVEAASGSRGTRLLSIASGRVMLRLDQPTSGNFLRSGPTASGQSGDSASPGTMITAPWGSSLFAGFQSARKLLSPA